MHNAKVTVCQLALVLCRMIGFGVWVLVGKQKMWALFPIMIYDNVRPLKCGCDLLCSCSSRYTLEQFVLVHLVSLYIWSFQVGQIVPIGCRSVCVRVFPCLNGTQCYGIRKVWKYSMVFLRYHRTRSQLKNHKKYRPTCDLIYL